MEGYPVDVQLDHLENKLAMREIVALIEDRLDIDIDQSLGSGGVPTKRGLAQILLALEREGIS